MIPDGMPGEENLTGTWSRYLPWCFCLFSCGVAFSIAAAHIALGLWLFVFFVSLYFKQVRIRRTPLDIPILIFAGIELLSGVAGLDPARSMGHFFSLWHIVIYFLVVNTVPDRQWLMRGVTILFITGGLNAAYGLTQYFSEGVFFFREGHDMTRWVIGPNREVGTFSHSMTFAGQMTMLAILGLSLLFWGTKEENTKKFYVPVGLIAGALVLSFVRSAWVGTVFGVLMGGAFGGKRVFGILLGLIGVTILAGVLVVPAFGERLKSIVDPNFPSNLARINMAKASWEIIKDDPVLGVGGGNYRLAILPYMEPYTLHNKSHPHNNLLAQTTEKGIIGLFGFLFIWVVFYKEAWRGWLKVEDGFNRFLLGGGMAALAGFHAAGMFETNFGDSEVAMMMWLIVGFVLWAGSRSVTHDRTPKSG